jgi:hypothetical protein
MDTRLTRRVVGALKAGLGRLQLVRSPDPRKRINRRWSLRQLLTPVLAGLCAGCRNLAQVERLTLDLTMACRRALGLVRRVPDTTMRDLLVRLRPSEMLRLLWQHVRQAHRQKALGPVHLPFGVAGVASSPPCSQKPSACSVCCP